jgi:5-methylcytosine-specific restriction endonuclease McrA
MPKHWRYVIAERDGPNCALCGSPLDVERANLDHIVPHAHGGRDRLENLQLTHFRCNLERGTDGSTRDDRVAHREGRIG